MASDDTSDVARKYQRLGGGYDKLSALLDRTAVSRMRAQLVARATGDVLEVAVGTGANLRHYPPGIRLTGLDLAAKALTAASRRAQPLTLAWTPVIGDVARLPLADASVDTVVCTLAGCTFPNPDRAFAEIRRVLRPDGQALFLEHVRSTNPAGRAVLRAVTPLTRAALGCHPDRDTLRTIAKANLTPELLDRAVGGLFLSIRATPTP